MKMKRIINDTMVLNARTDHVLLDEEMQLLITSDHTGTTISIGWLQLGIQYSVKIPERLEVTE